MRFLWKIIFLLLILFHSSELSYSQNIIVPEKIQAALLPKVLRYSSSLSPKTKLRLIIVYDKSSQANKDLLIYYLSSSVSVKAVYPNELEQNIGNCDVVYFMQGLQQLASLCKNNKVLSVSGISSYAEQGLVSIAFGILNNNPKIYLNLSSLGKEGQSLSSEILRIATVYN